MQESIKPGTRCECRDPKCPAKFPGDAYPHAHPDVLGGGQCTSAVAVRMVTVVEPAGMHFDLPVTAERDVPMCAACAEHAEKGGAS